MLTLIDNGQQTVAHDRHAFRVAPAHQWHFAQHFTLQVQFDQERVFTHHREQGFGLRVVGQVGRFVLFHPRQ
ncbi:hypothetical protein D3C84_719210 [compost metagenome]